MRKFFACFICMFVVVAHAETQSPAVCFQNDIDNCPCYKDYDFRGRRNSDATYNEFLASSSAAGEIEREGKRDDVVHRGFLCGYNGGCAVGTIVVGEYAFLEATQKAVYECKREENIVDGSERDNYEWVKTTYKDICHVRDNETPQEIVKDKLYFYNNEYCGNWERVASTEFVENTITSNNIDENYVNTLYNIERSMRTLSAFFAGVEQNVWRDADGKFNTARLASDATAGVILGTAGGLISNKIIKKNQIKKGFEGIGCYVGGQVVADYGDEFTVGMM